CGSAPGWRCRGRSLDGRSSDSPGGGWWEGRGRLTTHQPPKLYNSPPRPGNCCKPPLVVQTPVGASKFTSPCLNGTSDRIVTGCVLSARRVQRYFFVSENDQPDRKASKR